MPSSSVSEILNFVQITPRLAASGQPEREAFSRIQKEGYQVVIYLATPASSNHLAEESQIVTRLGMAYFHIPVIWEAPQIGQFAEFVDLLNQNQGKKIYTHCALNYRASCFMFLYKVLFLKVNPEKAWWDMLEIWEPDPIWNRFIRDCLAHYRVAPFPFLGAL